MNKENYTNQILDELNEAGYDAAVAIATEAEVKAQAACGQISLLNKQVSK